MSRFTLRCLARLVRALSRRSFLVGYLVALAAVSLAVPSCALPHRLVVGHRVQHEHSTYHCEKCGETHARDRCIVDGAVFANCHRLDAYPLHDTFIVEYVSDMPRRELRKLSTGVELEHPPRSPVLRGAQPTLWLLGVLCAMVATAWRLLRRRPLVRRVVVGAFAASALLLVAHVVENRA